MSFFNPNHEKKAQQPKTTGADDPLVTPDEMLEQQNNQNPATELIIISLTQINTLMRYEIIAETLAMARIIINEILSYEQSADEVTIAIRNM